MDGASSETRGFMTSGIPAAGEPAGEQATISFYDAVGGEETDRKSVV